MEYLVTSLKKLTNKRWLVYINYEPAFALYEGELKEYNISEDACISETDYELIIALLSKRATVRAMNLLKAKDYTSKELLEKLQQGYYPKVAVDKAMNYVKSFGYLDDNRYAANYIEFKGTSKSRKQIEQFLQHKGIPEEMVRQISDDYYGSNEGAEYEQLLKSMHKKLSGRDEKPDYESRQKIMSYYYRKGFSVDLVRKALDIVVDELYNN